MIKIFGKWFGLELDIDKEIFRIEIGLFNLWYFYYWWKDSQDFYIGKSLFSNYLQWKHIEIGMTK
jgi:hypothetical protein